MLLSRNYPPSAALEGVVARHYVFSAELPADFEMVDRLLSETPFIRVLLIGDWAGETAPGRWTRPGDVLFFGANARPMRVRVRGPFHVIGIALRPCGWKDLFDVPADTYADRLLPLDKVWNEPIATALERRCRSGASDAKIVAACEAAIQERLDELAKGAEPNAAMQVFERLARDNSVLPIPEVARRCEVSERQLERLAREYFGHSPKVIMRRSRFLDMATVMRGLGDPTQEELAALRYFDQSHLTREFHYFIDMTPAEFRKTPTPLLTAGLELRQGRTIDAELRVPRRRER